MGAFFYGLLLKLLPRARRDRDGAEMMATFAAMRADARGDARAS